MLSNTIYQIYKYIIKRVKYYGEIKKEQVLKKH